MIFGENCYKIMLDIIKCLVSSVGKTGGEPVNRLGSIQRSCGKKIE